MWHLISADIQGQINGGFDRRNGRKQATLGVDGLAMSNSNILAALIELLEESGMDRRDEILTRVGEMREGKPP